MFHKTFFNLSDIFKKQEMNWKSAFNSKYTLRQWYSHVFIIVQFQCSFADYSSKGQGHNI